MLYYFYFVDSYILTTLILQNFRK